MKTIYESALTCPQGQAAECAGGQPDQGRRQRGDPEHQADHGPAAWQGTILRMQQHWARLLRVAFILPCPACLAMLWAREGLQAHVHEALKSSYRPLHLDMAWRFLRKNKARVYRRIHKMLIEQPVRAGAGVRECQAAALRAPDDHDRPGHGRLAHQGPHHELLPPLLPHALESAGLPAGVHHAHRQGALKDHSLPSVFPGMVWWRNRPGKAVQLQAFIYMGLCTLRLCSCPNMPVVFQAEAARVLSASSTDARWGCLCLPMSNVNAPRV